MNTLTLWSVISLLSTLPPFSVDTVAAALQTPLAQDSENEYTRFFKGGPVTLSDGLVIESIDLRIRKEQPHPGFLVLTFSGICVQKSEVFARYPNMALIEVPRGRSMDEEEGFAHTAPWGELSFGFAVRAIDCLSSVVFKPR